MNKNKNKYKSKNKKNKKSRAFDRRKSSQKKRAPYHAGLERVQFHKVLFESAERDPTASTHRQGPALCFDSIVRFMQRTHSLAHDKRHGDGYSTAAAGRAGNEQTRGCARIVLHLCHTHDLSDSIEHLFAGAHTHPNVFKHVGVWKQPRCVPRYIDNSLDTKAFKDRFV